MTMTNINCPDVSRTLVAPRTSVLARLAQFHDVWRQRQVLKSLDSDALNDIGLTRGQADAEAKRAIWDAPIGWKR